MTEKGLTIGQLSFIELKICHYHFFPFAFGRRYKVAVM